MDGSKSRRRDRVRRLLGRESRIVTAPPSTDDSTILLSTPSLLVPKLSEHACDEKLVDQTPLQASDSQQFSAHNTPQLVQEVPTAAVSAEPQLGASTESTISESSSRLSRPDLGPGNPEAVPTPQHLWDHVLEELSPEERAIVDKTDTDRHRDTNSIIADIVLSVTKKKDLCNARRWTFTLGIRQYSVRDEADKIIRFLDKLKAAGDVAVNADPVHAGLPWALVRILLQTVVTDQEQISAMVLGMERVVYALEKCKVYTKLYMDIFQAATSTVRSNLEKALVRLYVIILKFLTKAVVVWEKDFLARSLSALWSSDEIAGFEKGCGLLEERAEGAVRDFERTMNKLRHKDVAEKLQAFGLQLNELSETNSRADRLMHELHELWKEQTEERTGHILQWLSPITYMDHHETAVGNRTGGTGDWILQREQYVDWEKSQTSMILWLHGIPGAGKTKLISRVIDHHLESRNHNEGLAYFYCRRDDDQRRQAANILRSFVKQLAVMEKTKIHDSVLKIYREKRLGGFASDQLSLREARRVLPEIMTCLSKTTLILDALDECLEDERPVLLEVFNELVQANPHVKILVSSRRNDDIQRQLRMRANIGVEAKDNETDIRKFIEEGIQKETSRRQEQSIRPIADWLVQEIVDTLFSHSQGMFQWAVLQMAQLLSLERDGDIRSRLGRLPKDLKHTYDEIMSNIKSQRGSKPQIAIRALQWLFITEDNVTTRQLVAAVCQDWNNDTLFPVDIRMDYMLGACQNLVTTDTAGFCTFSHLSVREYLADHAPEMRDSGSVALSVSLNALSSQDIQLEPRDHDRLLSLAVDFCRHPQVFNDASARTQTLLKRFLGAPRMASPSLARWLKIWARTWMCQDSMVPLYPEFCVCFLGMDHILQEWITSKVIDIDQQNQYGFSLLCFAIASGRKNAFRILLEHGASVKASEKPLWAALEKAISGDLSFLEGLVERGADLNLATGKSSKSKGNPSPRLLSFFKTRSLLEAAVHNGNEPVTRFLLANGADPDVHVTVQSGESNDCPNLLWSVLQSGHCNGARLLIEHGADFKGPWSHESQSTALTMGCQLPDSKLVQSLISRGADVNESRPDSKHRNALIAASLQGDQGNIEIIRLLLDHGAQFDQGYDRGGALIDMCKRGRTSIVEIILDHDKADINESYDGLTPLLAAVEGASIATAKMLVARGAHVDMAVAGSPFETALMTAVALGKTEMVRLLVDSGADAWRKQLISNPITPLVLASERHEAEILRVLLQCFPKSDAFTIATLNDALRSAIKCRTPTKTPNMDQTLHTLLQRGAEITLGVDDSDTLEQHLLDLQGVYYDEISDRVFDHDMTTGRSANRVFNIMALSDDSHPIMYAVSSFTKRKTRRRVDSRTIFQGNEDVDGSVAVLIESGSYCSVHKRQCGQLRLVKKHGIESEG